MLAVDTNILVYAHRFEDAGNQAAFELVSGLADGSRPWALPWPCVYEFFAVVTNPRIWKASASTPSDAWAQLDAWHQSPSCRFLGETDAFFDLLATFATRPRVRGPVIHDARIAALCIAHGVEALLTRDRDFSLFPELKVQNPLR